MCAVIVVQNIGNVIPWIDMHRRELYITSIHINNDHTVLICLLQHDVMYHSNESQYH